MDFERHSTSPAERPSMIPPSAPQPKIENKTLKLSAEDRETVDTLVNIFRLNPGLRTSDFPVRTETKKFVSALAKPPGMAHLEFLTLLYQIPELSRHIDQELSQGHS